jgi:hypothetical protein
VVQPNVVATAAAAGITNSYLDATPDSATPLPLQVGPAVRLLSATLAPGSGTAVDQATFTFDQSIQSANAMITLTNFGLVTQSGGTFAFTAPVGGCGNSPVTTVAGGTDACQSSVSTGTTTTQIVVFLPHGTLATQAAVGVFVKTQSVQAFANSTAAGKNLDSEVGASNSSTGGQTSGIIAAPQLTGVALSAITGGLGGGGVQATYSFDYTVTSAVAAKFHAYDADGTELTCASAPTQGTGTSDNTEVCTSFNQGSTGAGTAATSAQLTGIKLGTVDFQAVMGAAGNKSAPTPLTANPEGFANTTGP